MNKQHKKNLAQYYKDARPYKYSLEPVDLCYIDIIEGITDLYLKEQRKFEFQTLILTPEEAVKLGWRIAGYLEDVLSGIGMFKALTDKNREIFGTPIPLFVRNPDYYSSNKIDKKAITYLVWHFFMEFREDLILSPTHQNLHAVSGEIYSYLKRQLKNIPRGSKVKEFLSLSGTLNGQIVKNRLIWFGIASYLFRFSYENYISGHEDDRMVISLIDGFLQETATNLSGFSALDVFVEMVNLDEGRKKELQAWESAYHGPYKIVAHRENAWTAENMITKKEYNILTDEDKSFDAFERIKVGMACLGSIVPWNGEWRWSGQQVLYEFQTPGNDDEIVNLFKSRFPKSLYRYYTEWRDKAFEFVNDEYEYFVRHFKTDLVIFKDGFTMRDEIRSFYKEYMKEKIERIPESERKKYNLEDGDPKTDYPRDLLEAESVAVFYVKNVGMNMMCGFQGFVNALEKKGRDLTGDDEDAIFQYFTDQIIRYQLFHRLKKDYTFESVGSAFKIHDWQEEPDLEFLLRCYKGAQYKNQFPEITLV